VLSFHKTLFQITLNNLKKIFFFFRKVPAPWKEIFPIPPKKKFPLFFWAQIFFGGERVFKRGEKGVKGVPPKNLLGFPGVKNFFWGLKGPKHTFFKKFFFPPQTLLKRGPPSPPKGGKNPLYPQNKRFFFGGGPPKKGGVSLYFFSGGGGGGNTKTNNGGGPPPPPPKKKKRGGGASTKKTYIQRAGGADTHTHNHTKQTHVRRESGRAWQRRTPRHSLAHLFMSTKQKRPTDTHKTTTSFCFFLYKKKNKAQGGGGLDPPLQKKINTPPPHYLFFL